MLTSILQIIRIIAKKIKNFFHLKYIFLFGCILFSIVIFPLNSFAQASDSNLLSSFAELFSVITNMLTFLAMLLLNYGGDLLGTDLILGTEAMSAIRPMWQYMRNIVNIGFVLILLYLAFSNIFSHLGIQGAWNIKEKLPRVIIAIIAVNFSLLFFKVMIDAVNVGTISLLSIAKPSLELKITNNEAFDINTILNHATDEYARTCTQSTDNEDTKDKNLEPSFADDDSPKKSPVIKKESDEKITDEEIVDDMKISGCMTFRDRINAVACPGTQTEDNPNCFFAIKEQEKFDGSNRIQYNLFMAFGVYFQQLDHLPVLAAKLNSMSAVIDSVIFSTIMATMYVVALVAIFLALLARLMVLWVSMVFSPVIFAASILGVGSTSDLIDKMVTHLIMPLKIAVAFAVSFVMLNTMLEVELTSTNDFLHFGPVLNQFGHGGFGLLWKILTIAIFWKTAQWAVQNSEAQWLTDKVWSAAQSTGEYVARATTIDRQILPFPGASDGKVSPHAIMKALPQFIETGEKVMHQRMMDDFKDMNILRRDGSDEKVFEATKDIQRLTTVDLNSKWKVANQIDSLLRKYGTQILSKQDWPKIEKALQSRKVSTDDIAAVRKEFNKENMNTSEIRNALTKLGATTDFRTETYSKTGNESSSTVESEKVKEQTVELKIKTKDADDNEIEKTININSDVVFNKKDRATAAIEQAMNDTPDFTQLKDLLENSMGLEKTELKDFSDEELKKLARQLVEQHETPFGITDENREKAVDQMKEVLSQIRGTVTPPVVVTTDGSANITISGITNPKIGNDATSIKETYNKTETETKAIIEKNIIKINEELIKKGETEILGYDKDSKQLEIFKYEDNPIVKNKSSVEPATIQFVLKSKDKTINIKSISLKTDDLVKQFNDITSPHDPTKNAIIHKLDIINTKLSEQGEKNVKINTAGKLEIV